MEAGEFTPKERDRYNRGHSALCEGVREYIVGHYKVNGRRDTDYWRDNASNRNIPNGLASILAAWTAGQDIRPVVKSQMSGNTWGDLPWHSLLAGYGCFPAAAKLRPAPAAASQIAQIGEFVRRCSLNFEDHSKALEKLGKPTDVSREADMIAAE
jgi:hypothetical protein